MKTYNLIQVLFVGLAFMVVNAVNGQTKFSATSNINLTVSGTSTMHDWEMKSSTGECSATFTMDANEKLTGLTAMNLSVSAKALKSGKDAMDKNAYKSLKTDKNPNIKAVLKSATVTTTDNKNYTINAKVALTIAGKSVSTDLVAKATKVNDGSISIKGQKNISMSDYDIEAPSFAFGTIKTGNDIVIAFDVVLHK